MNCNNCGARLREDAKVCPNCGAFVDDGGGYTLLTSEEMEYEDYYSDEKKTPKKKKSGFRWFVSIMLTLLIVGCGAYYYFENFYNRTPDVPSVTFETGSGIINDDEAVIYAHIKDNSDIEYIHGVSLYRYVGETRSVIGNALSTDYQYTKNIDATFRTIFFDTDGLELSEGANVLAFEIKLQFYDSDEIFTYVQPI